MMIIGLLQAKSLTMNSTIQIDNQIFKKGWNNNLYKQLNLFFRTKNHIKQIITF